MKISLWLGKSWKDKDTLPQSLKQEKVSFPLPSRRCSTLSSASAWNRKGPFKHFVIVLNFSKNNYAMFLM